MEQCIRNLEQFRTTLRTGRTTWNNRQKFNFYERRVRQAKKAFFFVLQYWDSINNLEQCLEQLEQPRTTAKSSIFEKWGAGPKKGFFFFSLVWVLFYILKQYRTNLGQARTTLRTSRTTQNNRQKFNFSERRVRYAKKAFFLSYNNAIQLIIWNNVQNNQNNLEQPAKV